MHAAVPGGGDDWSYWHNIEPTLRSDRQHVHKRLPYSQGGKQTLIY